MEETSVRIFERVIDEVRSITAEEVAKKQDAAKLNFPNIIEKIKVAAKRGESECILPLPDMNEYDKKLLEQDGFIVYLQDRKPSLYEMQQHYSHLNTRLYKEWRITW